ncbi:MAG: hypothetical protein IJF87_09065 [Erysipelotrichaceae bacterium]|nr:hypothetical protein [Erysipelotrichaceae bacterium]
MKQKLLRTISMILVVLTAFSTGNISKAGAEEQKYWINPNGGSKYHRVHHCPSIHPRYYDGMIEVTENQLSMNPYNMLSPCNVCMDLDPTEYDLPIGDQENLSFTVADSEILQDLVIQHAKDNLTEVYGYTEEQADHFQFLFHAEGELEYWPDEDHTAYCYRLHFDPATGDTISYTTPFYDGGFENYPGEGNIRSVTNAFVENDWLHHWDSDSIAAFSQKVYEWGEIVPTQTFAEGLKSGDISSADAIRGLFLSCFGPEDSWSKATTIWLKELLEEDVDGTSCSLVRERTMPRTKDKQLEIELKNGCRCAASYYLETIPEEANLNRFTEQGWTLKEGILADYILPSQNEDIFDRGLFVLEKDKQRIVIALIRKDGVWEPHPVGPCILSDRDFTMTLQTERIDFAFSIEYESVDGKTITCSCNIDGKSFIHLIFYSITDESNGDRFRLISEGSGKWYWQRNSSGQESIGGGDPRYISDIYAMMHFSELPDSPESYEAWNRFPFPDGYYMVTGVHLREQTSSRSRDLGLLNSGTVIHKTGEADGDPFSWYQSELGFLKGYVASQYICVDDIGVPTGDLYDPLPVAEAIRKTDLKSGTGWFDGKITDVPEGTRMHVLFECDDWYYVVIPQSSLSFHMDVNGTYGFIPKDTVRIGNTGYDLDWP